MQSVSPLGSLTREATQSAGGQEKMKIFPISFRFATLNCGAMLTSGAGTASSVQPLTLCLTCSGEAAENRHCGFVTQIIWIRAVSFRCRGRWTSWCPRGTSFFPLVDVVCVAELQVTGRILSTLECETERDNNPVSTTVTVSLPRPGALAGTPPC